jgi:hypothetical protein
VDTVSADEHFSDTGSDSMRVRTRRRINKGKARAKEGDEETGLANLIPNQHSERHDNQAAQFAAWQMNMDAGIIFLFIHSSQLLRVHSPQDHPDHLIIIEKSLVTCLTALLHSFLSQDHLMQQH